MAERVVPWGSRIVGTGHVEAAQLVGNPKNWRRHPGAQQEQLGRVLEQLGFVQSVVVNKRTSAEWPPGDRGVETVVDGHLRVELAIARDEQQLVPVTYVDLSPGEEALVLAVFDPLGEMASRDEEQLTALVDELPTLLPENEVDLSVVLPPPRKRAKGLTHRTTECACCKNGCQPGCGCWRD